MISSKSLGFAQPVMPRWGCGYSVSPPARTMLLIETRSLSWSTSTAWTE
ncbi:hypothetical protein [Streptomyces sp. NBRC 110465]|nr:hypothetical protein [Streptomyces sp. NBRC 110465]